MTVDTKPTKPDCESERRSDRKPDSFPLTPADHVVQGRKWNCRIEQVRQDLDLAADFRAEGRGYAELDSDGEVVVR